MRILDKENCDFRWPAVVAVWDNGLVANSKGWRFSWSVLGDVEYEMTTNKSVKHFPLEVFLFYGQLGNNFRLTNNFNHPKHLQIQKTFSGNQFPSKQI